MEGRSGVMGLKAMQVTSGWRAGVESWGKSDAGNYSWWRAVEFWG